MRLFARVMRCSIAVSLTRNARAICATDRPDTTRNASAICWVARAVSLVHSSLTIFVILNGARVIAYWPQIVRVYRDPGCATAVSPWTWIVFTGANIATVIYALAELGDVIMAAVFGANTIGCGAIAMLTTYKRCRHRHPFWKIRFLESPPKLEGHFNRSVTAPRTYTPGVCARPFKASRLHICRRAAR
jgi:hypothetical protein